MKALNSKGVPSWEVDLNDIPATQKCLDKDIDRLSPINFILIRILEHLEDASLIALLFTLIDKSAPGSRFIMVSNTGDDHIAALPKNYTAPFFGPRMDMQFLRAQKTPAKLEGIPLGQHHNDEILVIQKIGR